LVVAENENENPDHQIRTSRDDSALREKLQAWLGTKLPEGAKPQVSEISSPSASGMSSETLIFDATWSGEKGSRESGAFVGRMAPSQADHPIFPSYDMEMQANVMRLASAGGVPVPSVLWLERDESVLGAAFFVMERIEGRVPTDIPTYVVEGFLVDASPEERRSLQENTVMAIAKIHAIDLAENDASFLEFPVAGKTALERHVANQRAYYEWAIPNRPSPLIEQGFAHLEQNWPNETSRVVSWGDSRIGNVMYGNESFEPVAILDWEMAGLGTRELDLGWLSFMHTFFQKLFEPMGTEGLPDFLRTVDLAETYQKITGHPVEDLRWYETYGALRHAIIMSRISERMIHFGQAEPSEDPDDRIPHRATLEAMLAGTFWDD
jgi:aminoglycoside phosphotransferase (APT) family kinase protein